MSESSVAEPVSAEAEAQQNIKLMGHAGHKTLADTPLARFFEAAVQYESSDLIMRGGLPPKLRLRGELRSLDGTPPTVEEFNQYIAEGITSEQAKEM
ncbi:MAG: hypothetical protein AAGA57_10345, partial [Planctomycetota bacterium]